MFLDPEQTLFTCQESSCENCEVGSKIVCHFNLRQLMQFFVIALPPFILGGWGVWQFGIGWFAGMVGIIVAFFAFIEIRVMCSHCPHYAEPGINSLKCWANYGSLKIWKYRPGPMSISEKAVFFIGLAIAFFYPSPFFFLQKLWIPGVVHLLLAVGFFSVLHTLFCSKCINFACPFNSVNEEARKIFFGKNPGVKEAWKV